jgi:hypothetical protein
LFSFRFVVAHLGTFAEQIYQNIQLGALIGLATGVGIEIAEYWVRHLPDMKSTIENDDLEEQKHLP